MRSLARLYLRLFARLQYRCRLRRLLKKCRIHRLPCGADLFECGGKLYDKYLFARGFREIQETYLLFLNRIYYPTFCNRQERLLRWLEDDLESYMDGLVTSKTPDLDIAIIEVLQQMSETGV